MFLTKYNRTRVHFIECTSLHSIQFKRKTIFIIHSRLILYENNAVLKTIIKETNKSGNANKNTERIMDKCASRTWGKPISHVNTHTIGNYYGKRGKDESHARLFCVINFLNYINEDLRRIRINFLKMIFIIW